MVLTHSTRTAEHMSARFVGSSIVALPMKPFLLAWQSRRLIWSLVRREVEQKYKGSVIGVLWSLVNPLIMLAIYTFVFSAIFRMRWVALSDDPLDFALMLFAGLLLFNLFAECVTRAAGLVTANPNLVKKVVFPLHVQAWSVLGAAVFQAAINLVVLLAALIAVKGAPPWTAVLIPVIFVPLCLVALGLMWFLSALGVYIRDLGQITGHAVTMMMFLSPLFYPIEAVPSQFQRLFVLNPLTFLINEARKVLVMGSLPDWQGLAVYSAFALLVACLGFWFFQRARPGFSDVL